MRLELLNEDKSLSFAGHRELLADFVKRLIGAHPDAEAHA